MVTGVLVLGLTFDRLEVKSILGVNRELPELRAASYADKGLAIKRDTL